MSTRTKFRGKNALRRGKKTIPRSSAANAKRQADQTPDVSSASVSQKLDRIEKQLLQLQSDQSQLAEFEQQTESIVERKVYEIKALSYVTLIVASVLLALVLGMVLSALGIKPL